MWRWKKYPYYSVQSWVAFLTKIVTSYLFISMRCSVRIPTRRKKIIVKLSLIFSRTWQYKQKVEATLFCRLSCLMFGKNEERNKWEDIQCPSWRLQNSAFFIRPATFSSHAALEKSWHSLVKLMNFSSMAKIAALGFMELGRHQSVYLQLLLCYCYYCSVKEIKFSWSCSLPKK